MTDTEKTTESRSGARQTAAGGVKILVEVGPVIAFVVAYNVANRTVSDTAIFWATGVYMVAVAIAVAYSWITAKRVPPMLIVTSAIVLVFGGLAIGFQSKFFAYIKPTVINFLLAGLIVGSIVVGRNIWKIFFSAAFALPDRIWRVLALRWAAWFVFLGVLNVALWPPYWDANPDVVWLNITGQTGEEFWTYFKLWGVLPLTFLFAMANVPITMKHAGEPDSDP